MVICSSAYSFAGEPKSQINVAVIFAYNDYFVYFHFSHIISQMLGYSA